MRNGTVVIQVPYWMLLYHCLRRTKWIPGIDAKYLYLECWSCRYNNVAKIEADLV